MNESIRYDVRHDGDYGVQCFLHGVRALVHNHHLDTLRSFHLGTLRSFHLDSLRSFHLDTLQSHALHEDDEGRLDHVEGVERLSLRQSSLQGI